MNENMETMREINEKYYSGLIDESEATRLKLILMDSIMNTPDTLKVEKVEKVVRNTDVLVNVELESC